MAYYDEFASGYYTRYPRRQIVGYEATSKELRSIVVTSSGEVKVDTAKATSMSTTIYTVTAASGGTQIATANPKRKSIIVQNLAGNDIYIKESALQSGEGLKVKVDGSFSSETYVGDLWAYAVVSGNKVVVMEEA